MSYANSQRRDIRVPTRLLQQVLCEKCLYIKCLWYLNTKKVILEISLKESLR